MRTSHRVGSSDVRVRAMPGWHLVRALIALGLGCFSATSFAADQMVTANSNLTFTPAHITINAGDTVTFVNAGGFHNVVSDPGSVTSFRCAIGCDGLGGNGNLSSTGWSAIVTFPTEGVVTYHCEAHGAPGGIGMAGSITVVAAAPAPRSDFNGDERSDLLWRNTINGGNVIWRTANANTPQAVQGVALFWQPLGTGDYNGDGRADIFWRNSVSGLNVIWRSASIAMPQAVRSVADPDWTVAGSGDYDGDGHADLLWRNTSTGGNVIWRSANATTVQALPGVPLAWRVVGSGDYNGDGRSDILWRNANTGANLIWRSGLAMTPQAMIAVPNAAWVVAGSGDFDGDGRADVFWRNLASGANVVWRVADAMLAVGLPSVPVSWDVVATGDYDGDGRVDVVWRNRDSGSNLIWRSADPTTVQLVAPLLSAAWIVVAPE